MGDKGELDRFADAMLSIREEIRKVETGEWPTDDNPLKNAPHTQREVAGSDWSHPYSREVAAFPAPWVFKGASSGLPLLASTTRLAIANSSCGLPSEVLCFPVWEHGVQFSGDLRSVFVQQGSGSSLPIHRSAHKQDFQIPGSTTCRGP